MSTSSTVAEERTAGPVRPCRSAPRRAGLVWLRERPAPYGESALAALWQRGPTPFRTACSQRTAGGSGSCTPAGRAAGPAPTSATASSPRTTASSSPATWSCTWRPPGWRSHGHETDPGYNGVILHVVLRAKGRVSSRQQSRARAPVASLEPVADRLRQAEALRSPEHGPVGRSVRAHFGKTAGRGRRQAVPRPEPRLRAGAGRRRRGPGPLRGAVRGARIRRQPQTVPPPRGGSSRTRRPPRCAGSPAGTRLAAVRALLLTASGADSRRGYRRGRRSGRGARQAAAANAQAGAERVAPLPSQAVKPPCQTRRGRGPAGRPFSRSRARSVRAERGGDRRSRRSSSAPYRTRRS